jgi:hypothetical protein
MHRAVVRHTRARKEEMKISKKNLNFLTELFLQHISSASGYKVLIDLINFYRARTVRAKRPAQQLHGKMPKSCHVCPINLICKHSPALFDHGNLSCIKVWENIKRHSA